jgi:hypothetical protein
MLKLALIVDFLTLAWDLKEKLTGSGKEQIRSQDTLVDSFYGSGSLHAS